MVTAELLALKLETLRADVMDVKNSLDKVTEAITKLALVEERLTYNANSLERAFKAIGKIEERINALELARPLSGLTERWVERGMLAMCGAAIVLAARALGIGS